MQRLGSPRVFRSASRWATLALLCCAAGQGFAQDVSSGAIRGTVSDSSGGLLPMATVVIVNNATGLRYSTVTDAEGRFAVDVPLREITQLVQPLPACRRKW